MRVAGAIALVLTTCLACKSEVPAARPEHGLDTSAPNFAKLPPLDQEVACTCSSKGLSTAPPTTDDRVPRLYVVERLRGVG